MRWMNLSGARIVNITGNGHAQCVQTSFLKRQVIGSVLTGKGETYMKIESDGFKIFEDRDDYHQCIIEMYNNELLLREKLFDIQAQIDDLRRQLNDKRPLDTVSN